MMRTKDGLIHIVESQQSPDYKGMLRCGMLFRKESKYRTKWVPKGIPLKLPYREVVAVRSGKKPTCLWCVIGTRQCP